jgi:glucose/mannose-6-phosphate isomerase
MTLSETLERLDPQNMHGAIHAFPEHLAEGWDRGAGAEHFGLSAGDFDGLVVCGMGGSAIGGDLLRTLAEPEAPIPVQVVRGYDLPGWVGPGTLVVASSYSGGTEETLSAFGQARERGATVVVVASGGTLMEHAQADDLRRIEIPGGLQPRAALGYSLGVLLRMGRALGLLSLTDEHFEKTLAEARERAERYAHGGANPARELAEALDGRLPVIYSGVGLLEAVNMRWRTQLHENAKVPAVGNLFAELDHNEIMGFEAAPPEIAGRMAVVVLRDADDHPQIQRRIEVTREIIEPRAALWMEAESEGESRLARMCSLVQLGDWASFWLAMRRQVDPTPVESIQRLKRTLAGA